ncbi:MAG: cytochrome c, partial [Pseudohongiellaceae bacterium]
MFRQLLIVAALAGSHAVYAADSNAGKTFFRQQCALCHSAEPGDNGGAQGPLLHGIFGREAASTGFSYTQAMASSGLTWNTDTLNRFLASPTEVVPGSSMVIPVQDDDSRANLIAYFEELGNGTFTEATREFGGFGGFGPPPEAEPPKGDPDWINDRPGRVHKV